MNQEQLAHAIRAACEVARDDEVIVVGSQSIHGVFVDTTPLLRLSDEVDLIPRNRREHAELLNSLGHLSLFHREFGFYVDVVDPREITLPPGWEARLIPFYPADANGNTGWCLEPVDLACSKLAAFREKDRAFVRELLVHRFINGYALLDRLRTLDVDESKVLRMANWVELTMRTPDPPAAAMP